jgi:hypothetical protein
VDEFPVQPRFPDARLAHYRDQLTVPRTRPSEGERKLPHLRVATDEPREPAGRRGMKARPDRRHAGDLIDLEWGRQSLHRPRTERAGKHISLDERESVGRQQNRARHGHLFHAGGDVRRLPDGGVVHVKVVSDGANDHLTGVETHPDVDRHAVTTV